MRVADLFKLAWDNLRRNQTRSVLTIIGVMIGVAALMTLLAYGTGLQQNAQREFNALELYNTLRVTSNKMPALTGAGAGGDASRRHNEHDRTGPDHRQSGAGDGGD